MCSEAPPPTTFTNCLPHPAESMETEMENGHNLAAEAAATAADLLPPEPLAKKAKVDDPPDAPDITNAVDMTKELQLETSTNLSTIVEPPSTCHSIVGTESTSVSNFNSGNETSLKGLDGTNFSKEDDDTPVYLGSVFDQPGSTDPASILPDTGNGEDGDGGTDESDIEIVFEQQNLEMPKTSAVPVDRTKIRVNLVHFQSAKKRLCEILENYRRLEAVGLENLLVLLPTCLPMLQNVVRQVTPVERMERLLSLQAVQPFSEQEQKNILDYLFLNFHEYHEGNQTFAQYMEMILMPELTVRLYALVNHISVEQAENEMFKVLGVLNYGVNTPWLEDANAQEQHEDSETSQDPLSAFVVATNHSEADEAVVNLGGTTP